MAAALGGDTLRSHARHGVIPGEAGAEMGILRGTLAGDEMVPQDVGGDGHHLLACQGLEPSQGVQADPELTARRRAVGIGAAALPFNGERHHRRRIRDPDLGSPAGAGTG